MDPDTTIETATEFLNETLAEGGQCKCPVCAQLVRNDRKGITKWQLLALADMVAFFELNPLENRVHAATLLRGAPGSRDHGVAGLRFWGLIQEEERPENPPKGCVGSRGLTGWYSVTQKGRDFHAGKIKIHKDIVKGFFDPEWRESGPLVSYEEAMGSAVITDQENKVVDGTTVVT